MLMAVLNCLFDSLSQMLRWELNIIGHQVVCVQYMWTLYVNHILSVLSICRKNVERRALLENMEGLFLAVDEIVDGGWAWRKNNNYEEFLFIYIYIYEYVICGLVWSLAVTFYSSHQSLYLCLPLQGDLGKRPTAGGPPCGAEGKRLLSCPHFQLLTIFSFFLESKHVCVFSFIGRWRAFNRADCHTGRKNTSIVQHWMPHVFTREKCVKTVF